MRTKVVRSNDLLLQPVTDLFPPIPDGVDPSLIAKEIGQAAKERLYANYPQLQEMLLAHDPIELLTLFAAVHLFHAPGTDPEAGEGPHVLQFHAELLQALLLRNDIEKYSDRPVDLPRLTNLVLDVSQAFLFHAFSKIASDEDRQSAMRRYVFHSIQTGTQALRNWGFTSQMEEVLVGIFSPLDTGAYVRFGIAMSELIPMFRRLVEMIEERWNTAIRSYHVEFWAQHREDPRAVTASAMASVLSNPSQMVDGNSDPRAATMQKYLLGLARAGCSAFLIDDDALIRAYGPHVDSAALLAVVDNLTFRFGDLGESNPEYFILDNPVWKKPFIRTAEGLFCLLPGLLNSFGMDMLEYLLSNQAPDLVDAYSEARSRFLEQKAAELCVIGFPNARVISAFRWTDDQNGREYETDVLVILGDCALVVEAKSAQLSDYVRRGAPESTATAIEKIFLEPSEQGQRFIRFAKRQTGPRTFILKDGTHELIDLSKIQIYAGVSVILEPTAILGLSKGELMEAGLILPAADFQPTLHITDMDILNAILPDEMEKFHYLVQLNDFHSRTIFSGDPTDCLGCYLANGLPIATEESDQKNVYILNRLSRIVDEYLEQFEAPDVEVRGLPVRARTAFWKQLLSTVRKAAESDTSFKLLTLLTPDEGQQIEFERRLNDARIEVAHDSSRTSYASIYDSYVVGDHEVTLGAIVYKGLSVKEAETLIIEHLHGGGVKKDTILVTLMFNMDSREIPYTAIAKVEIQRNDSR